MKRTMLALLCVILLGGSSLQSDKIYVEEDRKTGLIRLINTFGQDIFCIRVEKKKLVPFYIMYKNVSEFFPKAQFKCMLPNKKV
jgi:hypothetical protein